MFLRHLNLWGDAETAAAKAPSSDYYEVDQIPVYDCADPDYPFEAYL
jgi:hypothetical protein